MSNGNAADLDVLLADDEAPSEDGGAVSNKAVAGGLPGWLRKASAGIALCGTAAGALAVYHRAVPRREQARVANVADQPQAAYLSGDSLTDTSCTVSSGVYCNNIEHALLMQDAHTMDDCQVACRAIPDCSVAVFWDSAGGYCYLFGVYGAKDKYCHSATASVAWKLFSCPHPSTTQGPSTEPVTTTTAVLTTTTIAATTQSTEADLWLSPVPASVSTSFARIPAMRQMSPATMRADVATVEAAVAPHFPTYQEALEQLSRSGVDATPRIMVDSGMPHFPTVEEALALLSADNSGAPAVAPLRQALALQVHKAPDAIAAAEQPKHFPTLQEALIAIYGSEAAGQEALAAQVSSSSSSSPSSSLSSSSRPVSSTSPSAPVEAAGATPVSSQPVVREAHIYEAYRGSLRHGLEFYNPEPRDITSSRARCDELGSECLGITCNTTTGECSVSSGILELGGSNTEIAYAKIPASALDEARLARCSSFACPPDTISRDYAPWLSCNGQKCTSRRDLATCCVPVSTCDTYTCPSGLMQRSNSKSMFCNTRPCTADDKEICCEVEVSTTPTTAAPTTVPTTPRNSPLSGFLSALPEVSFPNPWATQDKHATTPTPMVTHPAPGVAQVSPSQGLHESPSSGLHESPSQGLHESPLPERMAAHPASQPEPSAPHLQTFYVYRAERWSSGSGEMDNIVVGDLAAVLHSLRDGNLRNQMSHLRRLRLTVQRNHFGPFANFTQGHCETTECQQIWKTYGYVVGCQAARPVCGSNVARWFSLPGACPHRSPMTRDSQCKTQHPGGACKIVTGGPDCTFNVEEVGSLSLEKISWVVDWAAEDGEAVCHYRVGEVKALFADAFPDTPTDLDVVPQCL